MTMTPALGALAQASDALTRAIADPQSGAEAAVVTTIDFTLLILGPIVGAFVGVVISVVMSALLRKAFAKAATASSILARVRRPGHFTFAAWGAWAGLGIALVNPNLSDWNGTSITTFLMHVLLIIALACLTWMAYAAAWVFEDAAKARQDSDQGRSRRFETQAQVLRRFAQGIVVVVGVVAIIGTFEVARQAMTTVLASAGVLSVIAGLAAQQTLGNVFAGLQLAFTDAIRVGDVVVAGDKHETGSVEEITLSYVVVRIWDERRLIIPCRYFTQTPFENWTRRAAAQLGTVELKLDWSAPMTLIRTKVEQLLTSTDLWDGRTWGVQITDSDEYTVTVRVLVSAKNSGHLSDLRAYLREQLISWIVTEEPWARPAQRIEPLETVTVEKDMSRERIARLAAELAGISGTNEAVAATGVSSAHPVAGERTPAGSATGGTASAAGTMPAGVSPKDPAHAARMVAARRKAKRARRRAMADRQRELAEGGPAASHDETQVISKAALRKIIEAAGNANPQLTQTLTATSIGRGERFFSGSADADERAAALEGPGEEAYAEREAEARRAQERREGHKNRSADTLDPEATLALAAVGVEPVVPEAEEAGAARDGAGPAASGEAQGTAVTAAPAATAANSATPGEITEANAAAEKAGVPAPADVTAGAPEAGTDAHEPSAGSEATSEEPTADDVSAESAATDGTAATESAADAGASEADSSDAGASADSGDFRAADAQTTDAQEAAAPADAPEREDAPAPDAPEETGGEEEAQASSDGEISPDEQETTPIPARETSVKHPVQVPPPVRTGRPVMTDTVQAVAPALVPPPEPTPAEMAASLADEETPDEPTVHPGWYAVAEEARLDAETRPTPTVKPARVSIMDFFPSVAPTGAEADVLRAVTGQIPVVERLEQEPDEGESAATDDETATDDESTTPDVANPEPSEREESASEEAAPEADVSEAEDVDEAPADEETAATDEPAAQVEGEEAADDADNAEAADVEATTVMDPVEAEEAGALDSDATQVMPAVDEPVDETLVMPVADVTEPMPEAAQASETEDAAVEEEAPAKKETAKKTSSSKAGAKKAPAKKAATKKAVTAKKGAKNSSTAAKKTVSSDNAAAGEAADATPAKAAKAPAKKAPAKKTAAKKGAAKKAAPKKAAAKKASGAGPATDE